MNIWQRIQLATRMVLKGEQPMHRPDMMGREMLMSVRSDGVQPVNAYTYLDALNNYSSYIWLRKAVKIIADSIAGLPVIVYDAAGEVMPNHPLSKLLTGVNDTMSSSDLWQWWTVDMLLGGESFVELVRGTGGYAEMWPRQPHTVTVLPDATRARYFGVAGYKIEDAYGTYELPADECLHTKFYNPLNPWRGLSVAAAAYQAITTDKLSAKWAQGFYSRSARPDYAIMTPQGTTPTEREQLLAEVNAQYGGADKAHRPMVLEQGISDIKILGWPPKDMEWIEQRKLSRSEVSAIFGVPDEIMGYGRDTYENFDTARRVLWTLTVIPITQLRDYTLTEYMQRVNVLKPGECVETDFSGVSELAEDATAKIDQAQKLYQMGVPFNRIDELLDLGVGPIDGGEVGFVSAGLVPVTYAAEPPEPLPEPEPIVVPVPEPVVEPVKRWKEARRMEYGSPEHLAAWEAFSKRANPHEKRIGKAIAQLFEEQRDEVLANLGATKSATSTARSPFNVKRWEKKFRETMRPFLRDLVREYGVEAARDIGAGIRFDLYDPNVVVFLRDREQRFAEAVNETTWERLQRQLNEGIEAGEGIPDLAARVEATMGDRIRSSGETIARTEVIGASNGGTLLSWKQSGVVSGKQWLATLDDRVRESHADAHGQIVGIDEDFELMDGSGPAPGQIGSASEDINCRCAMLAVLGD